MGSPAAGRHEPGDRFGATAGPTAAGCLPGKTDRGRATEWVSVRFAALAGNVSLPPIRFHDLRHGSASLLLGAGVDLKVVSAILGHATAAFTADVYAVVLDEMAEAAASAIEALRSPQQHVSCQQ